MNFLPEVLYHEIGPWLSSQDLLSFASMNILLSKILLKRVRRILIREEDQVKLYFSSQIFRDEIHSLIVDTSEQLKIEIFLDNPLTVEGVDIVTCKELSTTAEILLQYLIIWKIDLKGLALQSSGFAPFIVDEAILEIAHWMNSIPSLKEFYISSYDFTDFPVISNLESLTFNNCPSVPLDELNIPAYSNLRILKFLYCESIDDVSCLDRIHELHISRCHQIQDISCLNHNHKIVIDNCDSIVDYSSCFRHSKVIEVTCYARKKVCFDFSKLLEVSELDLAGRRTTFNTTMFIFPPCKTLRQVVVSGFDIPFTIPANHQIRSIVIAGCASFKSLSNFGSISSVSLMNLKIDSLEGLGMGNHVVEIQRCPLIRDFAPLKHCDKVIIRDCQGFEDISQVRGVKELTFSPADVNNIPEDLEGVMHLLLRKIPDDLDNIVIPNSLKQLEFCHWSNTITIEHFLCFCRDIARQVQQIKVVEISSKDLKNLFNNIDEAILAIFTMELLKNGINFLRKLN